MFQPTIIPKITRNTCKPKKRKYKKPNAHSVKKKKWNTQMYVLKGQCDIFV